MTTKVINIGTGEHYDVYIGRGRGSILGNPFKIGRDGDRQQVVEKFRVYFRRRMDHDPVFKAKVLTLKDKVLGGHCKPLPCHGDVYVEYLDG